MVAGARKTCQAPLPLRWPAPRWLWGPPPRGAGRRPSLEHARPAVDDYPSHRVRVLAGWNPQGRTRLLLEQVREVLEEQRAHLPLTCRQVFYRLVGAYLYEKTEQAYDRLLETLNRARRAGLIPFDAIRDDGVTERAPRGFSGMPDFFAAVRSTAETYRRDRMADQPVAVEVWVEAGGLVPQAVRVAHHYGATVYSSGGFDSLTAKYDAARRFLDRKTPTVVLHAGDFDPSGLSIFDSVAADISGLVAGMGGTGAIATFRVRSLPPGDRPPQPAA